MATPQTVAFHTLGCKLNFSETSALSRMFENHGFQEVSFEQSADVFVINTCSVTDFADKKCRNIVRQALRKSPQAKIVVVGCYAQLKPEEIASIPGVDLVLGAAEKFRILEFIEGISKATEKGMVRAGEVKEANVFIDSFSFGDRTRSFLKVQDGCDYKCSFCTIPQARGSSRSDTLGNVLNNIAIIAEKGVKEIVLTGVNLGDFGNGTAVVEGTKPKKEDLFIDLIKAIDKQNAVQRFRISSIEPNLLTDEIIEFVSTSHNFLPHFHIPLQSGSPSILRKMRRRYTREHYQSRIETIRKYMPNACIGADVIVGFPGETEQEFMETYHFIHSLDLSYLHVFTYSERANTPAISFEAPVPMSLRRERNERLRILSEKKKRDFYSRFEGQTMEVLFEKGTEEGYVSGFTQNYLKISLPADDILINSLAKVKLKKLLPELVFQAEFA
jgi:threonylcarbamoyladenosine tRNA methylthiotransferase MtaB